MRPAPTGRACGAGGGGACAPGAGGGARDAGDGLDGADEGQQRAQAHGLLREEGPRIHLRPPHAAPHAAPRVSSPRSPASRMEWAMGNRAGRGAMGDAENGGENSVLAGSVLFIDVQASQPSVLT